MRGLREGEGVQLQVPLTFHKCDCGHRTDLHDLKPVHLYCKCGSKYKYMTNISDPQFTMNCLACGAPVDLELNSRGTAYVTIGHKSGGGTDRPYVFRQKPRIHF